MDMDKIWLTLQLWMGVFCIILLIRLWIMTNDFKELKDFIYGNYSRTSHEISKFKNWIDDYTRRKEIEGNVVYGRKDHKKYIVVRALSDGKLLLAENPFKTNIGELSDSEVIKKYSEVILKDGFKEYIVGEILPDGKLQLYDKSFKKVKLSSIDEIYF